MAVDIPELDQPGSSGLLRTQWFPLVLSESAAFQIILLLSASNFAVVSSAAATGIRPHLLQMKCDAIRAINEAFLSEDKRLSDAVIGAVAKMASYEAINGTREAYQVHMAGLEKMVSIRGGLSALGLNGLLRRIIVWIDINSAILQGTPRFFPKATFTGIEGGRYDDESKGPEANLERFVAI
ncbi:hypothetical protein UCRPA7_2093 [Phaeoacremonium minimum UCRPA7]|uniref:Uncharacterized protein n=1 Tax=Phaeoacremonium minimum (strain UCR-PA7) TaxID=1286976 RepID=R8BSJ6_PHAM7|nr:hypothetical protein UCRPA7_2093 [Phaeoacremonium minimum UCRPA7]EOO02337.1 hypothetical protein UCRPA7_2093 [Phaeoacremonium minimum UCRPA7]